MTAHCPKCQSENIYQDGNLWICPECAHEWMPGVLPPSEPGENATILDAKNENVIRDANGNTLNNGDAVIVIKDLKIKGTQNVVKGGTKVRNIRLVDAGDGHDIACKIDGIGALNLKSEFVRKV